MTKSLFERIKKKREKKREVGGVSYISNIVKPAIHA